MRLNFTILILLLPISFFAQDVNYAVLSGRLIDKIEEQPDAFHSIHVLLVDQVDLRGLEASFDARKLDLAMRSKSVITALQERASESQTELLHLLKNSPYVHTQTIHSFWIANAIFVSAKKEMIAELSNNSAVEWIGLNGKLELTSYEKSERETSLPSPGGVEPGLQVIKAPALWAMGYTGYGQVAFTNDTGVDPTHPALATKYRGIYVPRNQAWFQYDSVTMAVSTNLTPLDCDDHGTHVTGTMLGLDRLNNDTIGVAFNAQWIGAPVLCGIGTEDNIAAFQWSINPDNDPNTSDDIPDVINNSWWDPNLDSLDCNSIYVPVLEAMEAAGIAVIFSAGNQGPAPQTISTPHNINFDLVNSFTVGALNGNLPDLLPIAPFSSHGPSHCGGEGSILIKPEVSAPGVQVRSSIRDGKYESFSGTSMASPHVCGAILLLKEAFPELTGRELKMSLYLTARDLGEPGEDNTYGMGLIDVLAAFNYLVGQGHVPVSPFRANDVMILDLKSNQLSCAENVSPTIMVENAGTANLESFEATYEVGDQTTSYLWSGNLLPNERATVELPAVEVPAGDYELAVNAGMPNGVADERPLNNILKKNILVSTRERRLNAFQTGGGLAICESNTALLRGDYTGDGFATFKWFDVPFGGISLGEGETFFTQPLSETTTFFADATYREKVGPPDKEIGENVEGDFLDVGLVFDAITPFILKSVKVCFAESGVVFLGIRTEDGDNIRLATKVATEAGEQRLELNWAIPAGKNLRFLKRLGKPLAYNTSGAAYPYEIDGIVSITGPISTDSVSFAPDAYLHFYDWEIEYDEPCGRLPVTVEVVPGEGQPEASFITSADTLSLSNGQAFVDFTDNSTDATQWFWHFGDGSSSMEQNPVHFYTETGSFLVSLTVTNDAGCSNSTVKTLVLEDFDPTAVERVFSEEKFLVFPNPTQSVLNVLFDFDGAKEVELSLVSPLGNRLETFQNRRYFKETVALDLSKHASGVYFLVLKINERIFVKKVVKTN